MCGIVVFVPPLHPPQYIPCSRDEKRQMPHLLDHPNQHSVLQQLLFIAQWSRTHLNRVVKSSWLPAKIAAYLVSIGQLFCFHLRMALLNKISLDWPLTLTLTLTQLSTSKLPDNPAYGINSYVQ